MMEETSLRTYLTNRYRTDIDLRADSFISAMSMASDILTRDEGGYAHIHIEGVLTPDGPDPIDVFFGAKGTSYKKIIASLYEADESSPKGDPIFLHVDSPGGMVRGAEATASAVADVASRRPVISVNQGVMASAALWAASPSTEIVSLGRSTLTGSIGAVATVVEYKSGSIRIHNFVNPESPDKVADPATDEGAKVFQDRVSSIYSIFRADLIAGRSGRTTVEKVESLRGNAVTAAEAMKVGLIDRVVGAGDSLYTPASMAGNEDGSVSAEARDREEKMNLSEFLKEHPEAQAELEARISQARSEGENEARERHASIVAKLKPIMEGNYPERVKTACADAISGTRSVDSVLDLVAIFDEIRASHEGEISDEEQEDMPDTPASGPESKSGSDEAMKRDSEWNEAIKRLLG